MMVKVWSIWDYNLEVKFEAMSYCPHVAIDTKFSGGSIHYRTSKYRKIIFSRIRSVNMQAQFFLNHHHLLHSA
jgi:hypothetical protein